MNMSHQGHMNHSMDPTTTMSMNHQGHMNHSMDPTTIMPMHHPMHNDTYSSMNHSNIDHGNMDHGNMDHGNMGHGNMGQGNHTGDHPAGHSMQMYFHAGVDEILLFEHLKTSDKGGMVAACFVLFFVSLLYEGLKYFREYLLRRSTIRKNVYSPSTSNGDAIATKQPEVGGQMLSGSHGLQTVLHMVQVFISYCLMLVFMTYNAWLCLAIVLGAGSGYFLFGWRRAMVVDLNEHCH